MSNAEKKYQVWKPFMESKCLADDITELLDGVDSYRRNEVLEEYFDCSDWRILHLEPYKKKGKVRFTYPLYWLMLPMLLMLRAVKYFLTGDSRFNQDAKLWKMVITWEKELRRF